MRINVYNSSVPAQMCFTKIFIVYSNIIIPPLTNIAHTNARTHMQLMDALLFCETRLVFFECPKEAATNHPSIRDLGPHEKPITLDPRFSEKDLFPLEFRLNTDVWMDGGSASRARISAELGRQLLLLQPVLQNCLLFNTPPAAPSPQSMWPGRRPRY